MKTLTTTPRKDGFRMPGEFEAHRGTYMIWPERPDTWREGGRYAQKAFAEVAGAIGKHETVTMLVSAGQYENALSRLPDYVRVVEMSNNDAWARDTGATFVTNGEGEIRGVDWCFNAWGGGIDALYFPWDQDDQVAGKMCGLEQAARYRLDDFVLEGGSIHTDGEGTILTTEACLLSAGRNPRMDKGAIEERLKEYLNAEKVIWLKRGIYLDETNEHVDNICCFVKPGVVTLSWTDDIRDPQYGLSKSGYETLSSVTDAKGRRLEIHKIKAPSPVIISAAESAGVEAAPGTRQRKAGDRLAASYINYYVCNGAVIMPAFDDPMDKNAKDTLQKLYGGREVIQIYTREILLGGGNIHCITQQVPQGGAT